MCFVFIINREGKYSFSCHIIYNFKVSALINQRLKCWVGFNAYLCGLNFLGPSPQGVAPQEKRAGQTEHFDMSLANISRCGLGLAVAIKPRIDGTTTSTLKTIVGCGLGLDSKDSSYQRKVNFDYVYKIKRF